MLIHICTILSPHLKVECIQAPGVVDTPDKGYVAGKGKMALFRTEMRSILRLSTPQIVDCAFTEKACLLYRILLNGNCNNPAYYGSSQHSDDVYNIGLWTDSVCFILLSLQIIIVDTKYAETVKAELIRKDANSTRLCGKGRGCLLYIDGFTDTIYEGSEVSFAYPMDHIEGMIG